MSISQFCCLGTLDLLGRTVNAQFSSLFEFLDYGMTAYKVYGNREMVVTTKLTRFNIRVEIMLLLVSRKIWGMRA